MNVIGSRIAGRGVACGLLVLVCALAATAQGDKKIPHLERRGAVTQLVVDGKPFLALGGELHNSSSSSMAYMRPIWPELQAMHLNTVIAPVYWELLEPREGEFDFALVDGLISDAHAHNMRLVLLWFGSWKNTYSSYVPEWVKKDTKRFPRVLLRDGKSTERLSAFSDANRKADALAFSALMKHVREVDSAQTVIMVQVENEVGVIPESRDFSPTANAAFRAPVPRAILEMLRSGEASSEMHDAWMRAGKKPSGSWEEIFGTVPLADDLFMAWHYASYIDSVAAAGKAQYALPMYTNAALIRPNYLPGQYNSGGPLPHSLPIYRTGAPHLDFSSPDIYFDDFAHWAGHYSTNRNPLFIPEAFGGKVGAANALYAFGQLNAIGFGPFGIEGGMSLPGVEDVEAVRAPISSVYSVLSHLAPMILEKQGTGDMTASLMEGPAQRAARVSLGDYEATITRSGLGSDDRETRVAVVFIRVGRDEFVITGVGATQVSFQSAKGAEMAGIASIDEEVLVDGDWKTMRRLNGDENAQGQMLRVNGDLSKVPSIYRVRLYKY